MLDSKQYLNHIFYFILLYIEMCKIYVEHNSNEFPNTDMVIICTKLLTTTSCYCLVTGRGVDRRAAIQIDVLSFYTHFSIISFSFVIYFNFIFT